METIHLMLPALNNKECLVSRLREASDKEYDVQVLQQSLRGREEGAAAVLSAAEAGRAGPRHRQAATRHPPDARHL